MTMMLSKTFSYFSKIIAFYTNNYQFLLKLNNKGSNSGVIRDSGARIKSTYVASMYVLRPRSLNRVYEILECQSNQSNTERQRQRQTETEIDRSYRSSSERDSEYRCLIWLQTEVLPWGKNHLYTTWFGVNGALLVRNRRPYY